METSAPRGEYLVWGNIIITWAFLLLGVGRRQGKIQRDIEHLKSQEINNPKVPQTICDRRLADCQTFHQSEAFHGTERFDTMREDIKTLREEFRNAEKMHQERHDQLIQIILDQGKRR